MSRLRTCCAFGFPDEPEIETEQEENEMDDGTATADLGCFDKTCPQKRNRNIGSPRRNMVMTNQNPGQGGQQGGGSQKPGQQEQKPGQGGQQGGGGQQKPGQQQQEPGRQGGQQDQR
jgi:hypothetical protein